MALAWEWLSEAVFWTCVGNLQFLTCSAQQEAAHSVLATGNGPFGLGEGAAVQEEKRNDTLYSHTDGNQHSWTSPGLCT